MTLAIAEAPLGTIPHRELANRFDIDRGSLLLHLAVNEISPGAIALTLLQAMGKDLRVTGGHSVRTDEHRTYAPIWAGAHNLTVVALLDAQQLRPAAIQRARGMLPHDTTLTLVCEPGQRERTRRRLQRYNLVSEPVEWADWLSAHPTVPQEERSTTDHYGLDHLPLADFLTFRHACRALNGSERFTAIDADYRRTYNAATAVPATTGAVIDHLADVTTDATSTAPMLVALRATQAAFFARGHLLHAHTDRILGVLSCNRAPQPADHDWRALRAYTRPERSAVAALYLLGVQANALLTVTVARIADALDRNSIDKRAIPPLARPLLATQLARRIAEGATSDDVYLNLRGARRHLEILIDARRDLGLPIDGRNLRDDDTSNATRLLHRLGLELRSLS